MIHLTHHDDTEEKTAEAPETAPQAQDTGSEPRSGSPLEWYLLKLLEPSEDAPHEPAFTPAETATPASMTAHDRAASPRPAAGLDDGLPYPVGPSAGAEPLAMPPAAKPKPAIRSYAPRDRAGAGRQKLMIGLIPILAIGLVVVLKHPLGARSTAKAAGTPPSETVRPVIPDVNLVWAVPALYEPGSRDPMQLTPPPAAVAVENADTTAHPTEPPVDLIVAVILYTEDKPAAIVDTQVVHEGQQISGATVEKIDQDGVQFERNGRRWKQPVNK